MLFARFPVSVLEQGGGCGRIVCVNFSSLYESHILLLLSIAFASEVFVATVHAVASRIGSCVVSCKCCLLCRGGEGRFGGPRRLDGPRRGSSTRPLSPWTRSGGRGGWFVPGPRWSPCPSELLSEPLWQRWGRLCEQHPVDGQGGWLCRGNRPRQETGGGHSASGFSVR